MLQLNTQRKFKFDIYDSEQEKDEHGNLKEDPDTREPIIKKKYICWLEFTFNFLEEADFGGIRKMIEKAKAEGAILEGNSKEVQEHNAKKLQEYSQNQTVAQLRLCLTGWGDIITSCDYNDEGEEINKVYLPFKNEDHEDPGHNQKCVFEWIRTRPLDWEKIETAWTGLQVKNSKTGVKELLNGTGTQESVSDVG